MTTSHPIAPAISARHRRRLFTRLLLVLLLAVAATTQFAIASEGFTEPYRTISVAAPEAGIIGKTFVEEGASVRQGEPLVQLDVALQQALLAIIGQNV